MSFKIYLWDALSPIEWSQAAWRVEGKTVSSEACEGELIRGVLQRHLPKDGLILDAGCGTAKWPIYLRSAGYRCVGVEISPDAWRMAREMDEGLPLVGADTRRMPLRTASIDAVLSLGVVEHDEAGPLENLRELRRVLKPGRLLVLAVPFNNLFRRLVVNHFQRWVTWRRRRAKMSLGFAEYRFTKREVRRFLRAAGFDPVAVYPNDLLPPKVMGLWVDYDNLFANPLRKKQPEELFIMPGVRGRIARALVRWVPWFVCGEVVFIARAGGRSAQPQARQR
jgi:SAM-dependent methyltransferase